MFYYKLGQTLLQIEASFATNWGSYYKLGQPLLQDRAVITNWGKSYYKLVQVLQIRAIITNWGHNRYFYTYFPFLKWKFSTAVIFGFAKATQGLNLNQFKVFF